MDEPFDALTEMLQGIVSASARAFETFAQDDHKGGALARFRAGVSVKRKSTEIFMQKYPVRNDPEERQVVRRWRLGVVTFYGSIAAVLLLVSAISDKSAQIANNAEPLNVGITASRQ